MKSQEQKSAFNLLKIDETLTVEQLSALFEKLTGRLPSHEELESARAAIKGKHDQSTQ